MGISHSNDENPQPQIMRELLLLTAIIEKFAIVDNPWNPINDIYWLAYAKTLEGNGIA
jgi:hypothetical protein